MFGRQKNKIIQPQKPANGLFKGASVGGEEYRPLRHKNGKLFSDLEYFKLLGYRARMLDAQNPNIDRIPTDYGDRFDPQVVDMAKKVVDYVDEGYSDEEIKNWLARSIQFA